MDELSGVHALGSNDGGLDSLVLVRIAESDDGKWSSSSWVMDDVLDKTLDVAVTLGEVERAELGGSLAVLVVALEDTTSSFTLDTDTASHVTLKKIKNEVIESKVCRLIITK